MAIFASTTTSGYSDPLKAYTIKALEKRQADMLAAQAQQTMPDTIATPIQGVGHVVNQLADNMRLGRAEQAAAEGRSELSSIIAQGPQGPNGQWSPQQQAVFARRDPEMLGRLMQQDFEARQQVARFGHETGRDTARFGHDTTTAAKLAETNADAASTAAMVAEDKRRAEERARVIAAQQEAETKEKAAQAQENRILARPTDDELVKLQRALERGEITKEDFEARKKKLLQPPINEQKFIAEQKQQSIDNQSALSTLDEASNILNSPKGIHAGRGGGITTQVGKWVSPAFGGPDDEKQQNTQRFNQIMGGQALLALTQMKGASSDKDVAVNFEIVNNPNESIDNKRKALAVLRTKLDYYVKLNAETLSGAGAEAPKLPGAGAAAAPAPSRMSPEDVAQSIANAKAAVASGKWTVEQANAKLKAAGIEKGL